MLAAATAAALAAGSAQAKEPSHWVKCDGLPKPEGAGTTLARIGAVVMTGGLLGLPEGQREVPAASGAAGVQACTAALADPALGDIWARKASLLRSRALHHAEADDLPAALADLQAVKPVTTGRVGADYFARSAGVSIQLFEAAVLARQNRLAEAEALAVKAADARPWSNQVQSLASAILAIDPTWTAEEDRVLTRRAALNPSTLLGRAAAREWGNAAGAADDWARTADTMGAMLKAWEGPGVLTGGQDPKLEMLILYPRALAKAALTAARVGRDDQARERMTQLKALKPWTPPVPVKGRRAEFLAPITTASKTAAEKTLEAYQPIIDAQLLANAGKTTEAAALLKEKSLPLDPGVIELLTKVSGEQSGGPDVASELRRERLERLDVVEYAKALPILETRPNRSPFTSQGPYGFRSNNGFLDRVNKTTGGRTIEYSGNLAQPVVEELLLLRAAQLAREAKAPRFAVTDKRDFKRYHVTTMYGAETSRTANGFESQADIVFADAGGDAGLTLDADKVWTELSPFYVFEPAKPARR